MSEEEKQIKEIAQTMADSDNKKVVEALITFLVGLSEVLYQAGFRKQNEWISVEERLPERCGYYLGCTYKGGMLIAPFFPVFANDKPEFHYKIAYWMPLPEPPKMKGGAE